MAEDDAIIVSNLNKRYCGVLALNGVSFSIKRGTVVGLIGPNGAGKSSMLKILSGIIRGTSGDVRVNGISLAEHPMLAKQHTSFMLENNPLPDHMRVGEYLRFRAELKGVNKVRAETEKVMRHCDLYYEARYRMIKTLSKGYRQRVGIADAMLGNSNIVILDEPTIGLDPHQIIGVRKIIDANRGNKTIIISSHILSELESICDDFIIINRGNIVAQGSLKELAENMSDSGLFHVRIIGPVDEIKKLLLDFSHSSVQVVSQERLSRKQETIIRLSADDHDFRHLITTIVNNKNLSLLHVESMKASLEEIFLYATRRCHEQDMTSEI